jgi:regulation of enolase protein 1 (concanavalin A-like superfamily)
VVSVMTTEIPLDANGWSWTREPIEVEGPTSNAMSWTCGPDSDFWRLTAGGATKHDGYAYVFEIDGDFELRARFELDFNARFDHGGLIMLAGPERWLKAAFELEGGEVLVGAVHTRSHSDWSCGLSSLPGDLRVKRERGTIEVFTLESPDRWRMIRQLYLDGPLRVGPFSAAPTGAGYGARVSDFYLGCTDPSCPDHDLTHVTGRIY